MIRIWENGTASVDLELTVKDIEGLIAGVIPAGLQADLTAQLAEARAEAQAEVDAAAGPWNEDMEAPADHDSVASVTTNTCLCAMCQYYAVADLELEDDNEADSAAEAAAS